MRYPSGVRVAVFALWVLAAAGCGAAGAPPAEPAAAEPPADDTALLAESLPPGANRCAAVRPALLPARRRAIFVRLSHSDPIPWTRGAPIRAWASAVRAGPDGHRSMVALARVTEPPDRVRAWLDEFSPRLIRWDGEGAEQGDPAEAAYRARFVDDRTLRIQKGSWPVVRGEGPGAEARCARLARAHPEAVEVASHHGDVVMLGIHPDVPRHTDTIIVADSERLEVTRRVTMASAEQAEERREDFGAREADVWSSVGGELLFDRVQHERRGRVLVTRMRMLWEDLVLAAEDQRRMAAAIAEDQRRHRPRPPERIDVQNLAVVGHQVALWSQAVDAARGAARRAKAAQLRTLLERAVAAHPGELGFSRRLARLLIDELDEGRAAAEVVEDVLARHPRDERSWRVLRREAAAAVGPEALARVLVSDEVVAAADADRAARDLAALRRSGVDYEFAEGVWLAAQAIERRTASLSLREVDATPFPLDAFTETLGELSVLGARNDGPRAMYVVARGERSDHHVMWHPEEAPVVEVGVGAGERRVAGVATIGDARTRAMGRALFDSFTLGPLELTVLVVPLGGSPDRPEVALRLGGTLETDRFVLDHVSGPAARASWGEVARLLARPLFAMEPDRVFPPPELVLELRTEREMTRLLDLASDRGALTCARTHLRVQCTTHPESPGAPLEVLRRFAAERLRRQARLIRQ